MATPADSRDVKSLNNSEGTNKFSFKNVGEKMEDTKMEKVRAEASEGSTFIKDSLVELRSPYHANAEILMTKYDHRVL
ncbi:hypothetical protein HID58_065860 [Brassica napus]|uniref:Uncharacterized protein n=1 Tax=Brassica napus TaxID=3708 RepID=A0ABQ7ZEH3_BRANA|nr:hypothetical protein HID58_065860 [Brassica napus]